MESKHRVTEISEDFMRIRRNLQEGRRLAPDEYHLVKVMIESLVFDLERNQKREDNPLSEEQRRSA